MTEGRWIFAGETYDLGESSVDKNGIYVPLNYKEVLFASISGPSRVLENSEI